jgi:hypothetical protein
VGLAADCLGESSQQFTGFALRFSAVMGLGQIERMIIEKPSSNGRVNIGVVRTFVDIVMFAAGLFMTNFYRFS